MLVTEFSGQDSEMRVYLPTGDDAKSGGFAILVSKKAFFEDRRTDSVRIFGGFGSFAKLGDGPELIEVLCLYLYKLQNFIVDILPHQQNVVVRFTGYFEQVT
ncbi:MAG: hypothetical protein A2091_13640 [Desulfuromonadales bacterium GWD2_61_12]|nr:MAG: hypothetical protein A2091_13640 [Desulfuromonadales bacterium GWD2_61_12]